MEYTDSMYKGVKSQGFRVRGEGKNCNFELLILSFELKDKRGRDGTTIVNYEL